jgi:hypothetical protein
MFRKFTIFFGVADYPDLAVRGKMGRMVESVVSVSVIIFLSELVRARFFYSELRARFFYLLHLGSSSSSVMSSSDSSCDSLLEGRFLNSDSSDDEEQETVDSTGLYGRYARLRFIKQQQTKAVLLMKVLLKDSASTRNPKWNSYRIIWLGGIPPPDDSSRRI